LRGTTPGHGGSPSGQSGNGHTYCGGKRKAVNIMEQGPPIQSYFKVTIPKEWAGMTVEQLLKEIWNFPRKFLHLYRMSGRLSLNGKSGRFSDRLQENDELTLPIFAEPSAKIVPSEGEVSILYEDEHLLVANKKANMLIHPDGKTVEGTLSNILAGYLAKKGDSRYIQAVHRLDKDTTGAVLFAKHPLAKALLDRQLASGKIKRTYYAIVHGRLKNSRGTIAEKIGRDRHHPSKRRVSRTGREAVTCYEAIGYDAGRDLSIVSCRLQTGRTHQIRVHFSYIGHPLAGDVLYGGKPVFPRQALHAKFLTFVHPFSGETIEVEAPYVDDPPIFRWKGMEQNGTTAE